MSDWTVSERIVFEMAETLLSLGADLGDERSVEQALVTHAGFWAADIDKHMRAAIDRARALRAGNIELIR